MAIFKSVNQALHFAYAMEAYEIGAESAMMKALRRVMMELGIWEEEGFQSSVDFSGLTRIEVRGQCAMIRAMVESHLPEPERWAVRARYEPNVSAVVDGKVRPCFPASRDQAIRKLSRHLSSNFDALTRDQLDIMVARSVDGQVIEGGYRVMAERLGMNHMTYGRTFKRVRNQVVALENQATERLWPLMVPDLVDDGSAS